MLEVGIQNLVAANAGVQALLGNPARFYPVVLPEDPAWPCASYQLISDVPDYLLRGVGIEVKRLQVDSWSGGPTGASYLAVKNIDAAIRAVLDRFTGQLPDGTNVGAIFVANSRDEFEQDARAYRVTTDYMIHFYPAAG
jgi:Protein of unknown function (DUF3168)